MKNNNKRLTWIMVVFVFILVGGLLLGFIVRNTEASNKTVIKRVNMNAVEYITDLYNDNDKTVAVNNNINYNYANAVSLMDDNFGNIRYFGASPNNYIDLGEVYRADIDYSIDLYKNNGFDSYSECISATTLQLDSIFKAIYDQIYEIYENGTCPSAEPSDMSGYSILATDDPEECAEAKEVVNKIVKKVLNYYGYTSMTDEFKDVIHKDVMNIGKKYMCGVKVTHLKGEPILYRIVGVFDGKLKVIREDNIGIYSWHYSEEEPSETTYWNSATLMRMLNPGYENEKINGSLWYNSKNGNCYDKYIEPMLSTTESSTTECDFTANGLSDNVKNIISEVTWNVGESDAGFANQAYKDEQKKTWNGKIGLLGLSDNAFATNFNKCPIMVMPNFSGIGPRTLDLETDTKINAIETMIYCSTNNWLFGIDKLYELGEWLITPHVENGNVWLKLLGLSSTDAYVDSVFVRPAMYLVPGVNLLTGDGSKNDPYTIGDLYSATINYYYLEDGKETTKKIKDSDIINNLEDGYTEVVKSPKIEGCKANKDVTIKINNGNFIDNVYYSCDITENVKTGNIITIIISLVGVFSLILIIYYYLKRKKNK